MPGKRWGEQIEERSVGWKSSSSAKARTVVKVADVIGFKKLSRKLEKVATEDSGAAQNLHVVC
jgi:hypothetical protein